MSVPIDRDETGRSKQPYALNRARGTHRAGGTAGRDDATRRIARDERDRALRSRSRLSRVQGRRTILAVRSCLCQRSAQWWDARRRAERSLPWYGRRARESSRRFGRSTLARESSSVGRQPNAAHPRGDLRGGEARATATRARARGSRRQTGRRAGAPPRDIISRLDAIRMCDFRWRRSSSRRALFFHPAAMALERCSGLPGRVLCFQGSVRALRGTLDARADLRERTASSRPRSSRSGLRSPRAPTRETSAHRHDASARGRRSRFRRRRQRIRRWSLAWRQRGLRRPRRSRRPRRLRRWTSGYRRRCVTSDPRASSRASPRAREPNANTPQIVGLP